jgi:hypothetical protein
MAIRLTESKLRQIIREEARRLQEGPSHATRYGRPPGSFDLANDPNAAARAIWEKYGDQPSGMPWGQLQDAMLEVGVPPAKAANQRFQLDTLVTLMNISQE